MNSLALWTVLVQTCLFVCSVLSGEDFYSQLRVERSATTREIRRAFKKLALTEHPDKNIVSIPFVNLTTSPEPSLGFFQKSNLPPARENKG